MALFWDNPAAEPKRLHRFLVDFTLPSGDSTQIFARTFIKPAYTVAVTEHQFLDKTFYYPGKITWNETTIQFVDSLQPDMDFELQNILRQSGYVYPSEMVTNTSVDVLNGNARTVNKLAAVQALGAAIRVTELDGEGLARGTYKLNNPFITSVSYATLDYASEDLLTVDCNFRYDWAEYTLGG